MSRSLRLFIEFVTTLMAVLLLILAALIWRLSANPVNSTFLTPYIEAGIEQTIPGAHAQIAHTLLTWDNVDHSLALHADGVAIRNGENSVIAEVPSLDIRLSAIGFIVGQFLPTELTVDHPRIRLDRHADGRLFFAAREAMSGATGAEDQANMRQALQQATDKVARSIAMRHLTVYRAVVAVHDEASQTDWAVNIPEISLMHTLTQLVGTAKVDLAQKDRPASLELHYAFDRAKGLHRVSTRFQDITPSQLVGGHPETLGLDAASLLDLPLSGEVEAAFNRDLDVAAAAATLHGGQGFLRAPRLWDKPRALTSFDIEGDFDSKAHKLNLITAAFDFNGAKFDLTGSGHAPADPARYDLDFAAAVHFKNVPMDGFGDLWPARMLPDARDWIVHNLGKGRYEKGDAEFSGSLAWQDLAGATVTAGQGKVIASHASVTYIDGMPPVDDVDCEAHFDLKQMSILINRGNIGDLQLQPFTVVISGLADADQSIEIPAKVAGPIPLMMRFIDHPPLRYAAKEGLKPDAVTGTAEVALTLRFELLKTITMNDIDLGVNAKVSNVASSQLVKGFDLSQGEADLAIDKNGLAMKGTVAVDKVPLNFSLRQAFSAAAGKPLRQIDLDATIKDEQWKTLGIDALAAARGNVIAHVRITDATKTKTLIAGNLDMTASEIHVDQLGWKKPAGAPAQAQFDAETAQGKDIIVTSLSFKSTQALAQGKAVLDPAGLVKSISLEPLVAGRTSADVYFTRPEDADGALRFEARGAALDISGMKDGKDSAAADPRPKEYRLKLGRLYTSGTGLIAEAEGFAMRDDRGWSAISLHGLADGDHKFAIELTPQADGTRSFSVTCDDFGKMLKGLGFTDAVTGGAVAVTGASASGSPRVIDGTVKIGSFSVGNLPALVLLLNATSPFGFAGILSGSASFEHLTGRFRWNGDMIEGIDVNAAGSSVGMNVNGKVDMNSGKARLNGTMVPFSLVNRMLGSIPLLGDILTGGDGGGILAVAFRIDGNLNNPQVSVNPVSLLTPGFLRTLFFGGENGDENNNPERPDKAASAAEGPVSATETKGNINH